MLNVYKKQKLPVILATSNFQEFFVMHLVQSQLGLKKKSLFLKGLITNAPLCKIGLKNAKRRVLRAISAEFYVEIRKDAQHIT